MALESAYTSVISGDGKVLWAKAGKIDIVEPRRVILVNLPDTRGYVGQQAYWTRPPPRNEEGNGAMGQ